MANDFSINLNGEKLTLREGMKINELKKQEQKALFSIFDFDCNGELSEEESYWMDYDPDLLFTKGGDFSSIIENNKTKLILDKDYDGDGHKDITVTWTVDNENNRLIEKTVDSGSNGIIEGYETYKYNNETGKISQIKTENYRYNSDDRETHLHMLTRKFYEEGGIESVKEEYFVNGIMDYRMTKDYRENKRTDIRYENGKPVFAKELIKKDEEFLEKTTEYENEDGKTKITYTQVPEGWSLEQVKDAFGD